MKRRSDRYKKDDTVKKKKKKFRRKFFGLLIIILLLVTAACLGLLYYINILPFKYYGMVCGGFALLDLITIILILSKRGWKKKMIGTLLCLLITIAGIIGIVYECNIIGLFAGAKDKGYKIQNYDLIVLNDSKYKEISDIENEYVGILNPEEIEGLPEAIARLNKKVDVYYSEMDDVKVLEDNLLSGDLGVIMLEDSYYEIAKEENVEFSNSTKVISKFEVKVPVGGLAKEVDITKEPFTIFISGIDTYGEISSVSRSDVNMLVTVNPNTHKILMTSIPRDYYVHLHGITSYKDKITHAGIHGIDMSVKTAEDLLDCDINYYVKVNFSSVIDIVDALGGIEVESPYTFTTYDDKYTFNKGYNKLDGEEALYFVRERKAFDGGDRTRNQNQQLVLTAIINKMLTKSMITKYDKILDAVDGSFVTNLGTKNLTNLIKKQIKNNYKWKIESYYLEGEDSSNYTYSYKSAMSYVMEPDEDSVKEATAKIKKVLNEGKKK